MIPRDGAIERLADTLRAFPVAALLGPRQCGKTTLARAYAEREPSEILDLENPVDAQRLTAPLTVLESMSGLVMIDEILRMPKLFELIHVLVDRPNNTARFLVIGSASPQLVRDVPQLGITVPAETLRRFWTMVAHYHGQVWNAAQLARSLGTSENAARRYLVILAGSFVVRVLPPWFENMGKRQVKAPKVYVRDSGVLHALLQLGTLRV